VLHRWGLLPVRGRLVEGDTIRLPASLLGPMGADFDGDTVALFTILPGQPIDCGMYRPSTQAWDETFQRPMFLAGKQYRYGLGRLMADAVRLENLQEALRQSGAPTLNGSLSAGDALTDWVRRVSGPDADGSWWSVVEECASIPGGRPRHAGAFRYGAPAGLLSSFEPCRQIQAGRSMRSRSRSCWRGGATLAR
jgi:hypothetical protein